MFSKLKHRLDRKSKSVVALLAMAILLCGFTGCERSTIPDGSEISYSETGFDIERIRKNVIVEFRWIKGHAGHPENERCDRLAVRMRDYYSAL